MNEKEYNAMMTLFWYIFLSQLNNFSEGKVAAVIEEDMRRMRSETG